MTLSLPNVVLITGTSTEVGKTIATAAIACALRARGTDVTVVKVAQTGVDSDEDGDAAVVEHFTSALPGGAVPTRELVRLPEPLAPDVAARRAGVTIPTVGDHVRTISEISRTHSIVLVEGSGGLLVHLDARGGTLADIGVGLRYKGVSCGAVLVAAAGLGTLNHSALTAEALQARHIPLLGVVLGSWPTQPDLAEECNVTDLPRVAGTTLWGQVPAGIGQLAPTAFAAAAPGWLPALA